MSKKLKFIDKITIGISCFALAISLLSIYFQFFNKRHTIFYSALPPNYNNSKQTITIPLLLKNVGNQTEVILEPDVNLERRDQESSSFNNLLMLNKSTFPLLLAPEESRLIELNVSFKNYLLGSYAINTEKEFMYYPITTLDSLKLNLNISFITKVGLVSDKVIEIGYVTFDNDNKLVKIDCNPIELKKLPLRWPEYRIVHYTISNNPIKVTLDPRDPYYNQKLRFIKELEKDSIFY